MSWLLWHISNVNKDKHLLIILWGRCFPYPVFLFVWNSSSTKRYAGKYDLNRRAQYHISLLYILFRILYTMVCTPLHLDLTLSDVRLTCWHHKAKYHFHRLACFLRSILCIGIITLNKMRLMICARYHCANFKQMM